MKKNDNNGFSLVELIIIIAIMSIVLTMLAANLNFIGNSQAKSLANAIKTAVGQVRIQTMGKYEAYLYIYRDSSDNMYYKETWLRSEDKLFVKSNREKIGKNKPTVKYTDSAGTEYELNASNGLLITFDRSSGKEIAKDIKGVAGAVYKDEEGNVISDVAAYVKPSTTSVICEEIKVSFGTKEYVITIVPATGKIQL